MANEGDGQGGGGDSGSGGDAGGYGSIRDILRYLNHWGFGSDGDYTNSPGYGGVNIGPPGSKEPERDREHSVELLDVLMAPSGVRPEVPPRSADRRDGSGRSDPYGGGAMPAGSLYAFAGMDVDAYRGLPLGNERPDAFTGAPAADPFVDDVARGRAVAPLAAARRLGLLSSPYLLAQNDVVACDDRRASCMPPSKSDANQSSVANETQAELDASYRAIEAFQQGKLRIIGTPDVDVRRLTATAAQVAGSDEYKLAFAVNQLRDHPLEIRRSAVSTGLWTMTKGGAKAAVGVGLIYGTGGLALPLAGAMGLAAGVAEFGSGFALAVSGADSTETIRMEGQLDYVFALTSSPTRLVFGTTGLVLSSGDVGVSQGFAEVGAVAEDLAMLRGDPSKLYSAVIPGVGTKAEKGASALLLKNMSSLASKAVTARESGGGLLLPGNRLRIVNPHFSDPGGADKVQGALTMVSGRFAADPRLVGNYLGQGELRALSDAQAYAKMGDWEDLERLAPTLYGKAVERALDRALAGSGLLSHTGQLRGPGGRFVSSPDWTGLGPFSGKYFESTTAAQLDVHMARGYPSTTVFMSYDIPTTWYFFLTP